MEVDGASPRGLWPPDGGRLCSLRSGGDSACGAEGGGLPYRAMLIKSALRDLLFCVIGHDKHSADWLAALASPFPASPDFSTGKRVTRFSGRFASLRIVFPCHPYSGGRINRSMLSCRDMAPWLSIHSPTTKWGERWWCQPPKGDAFPTPAGRLYGFRRQRRHKKWRPKAPYLASAAILYTSRGREPGARL